MSCSVYKEHSSNESEICLGVCVKHHIEKFFEAQDKDFLSTNVYKDVMDAVEKPLIEVVLDVTKGNQLQAAKILGLNRNTLRKKITELKIIVDDFAPVNKASSKTDSKP